MKLQSVIHHPEKFVSKSFSETLETSHSGLVWMSFRSHYAHNFSNYESRLNIEYMPSYELFSEQRDWWSTPYKFNGKELDQETGLYYYGARYHAYRQAGYTPEIGIWLSVDPLSDERPSLSPYNYCQLNPVMRVDPTGMLDDEFGVTSTGEVKLLKRKSGDYELYKLDNNELMIKLLVQEILEILPILENYPLIQNFKYKQFMVEKTIKLNLVILIIILLYSCRENNNHNAIPMQETLYLFDTCVLPKSSGMLINQQLSHYETPNFLKSSFDKVIKSENSCPCYKKNTTGFDVFFYCDTLGNMMQIRTIHKIYIKSYHNHSGLFLYKNHLFFCRGDYEEYNFDFIKKATVFSYKPLDFWAEPKRGYFGYSQHWFMIDKNNKVKLTDFYECN